MMQERLEAIVKKLGADTGTLHLVEDGVLVLKAKVGIPPQVEALVARVPVGKGMAGLAVERNAPVSSCNIQTDRTGDVRPGARRTGVGGAIVVPVRDAAGRPVGALGVGVQREHEYSAAETAALEAEAGRLLS
jgi:putative methionine-R-sulfoxide reductase with GAF domain